MFRVGRNQSVIQFGVLGWVQPHSLDPPLLADIVKYCRTGFHPQAR